MTHEGDSVQTAFIHHYDNFLGCAGDISLVPSVDLFSNSLDMVSADNMIRPVTCDEIKKAMFSIGDDKALGLDGYTSAFFKNTWSITGEGCLLCCLRFL